MFPHIGYDGHLISSGSTGVHGNFKHWKQKLLHTILTVENQNCNFTRHWKWWKCLKQKHTHTFIYSFCIDSHFFKIFSQWIINQPNPPTQTLRRTAPRVGFDPINRILASWMPLPKTTQGSDAWPLFPIFPHSVYWQTNVSFKCLFKNTSFLVARLGLHVFIKMLCSSFLRTCRCLKPADVSRASLVAMRC